MEAEDLEIAEITQHLSVERAAECVRGVKEKPQVALSCDVCQRRNVARPPPKMDTENCGRAVGNERQHVLRVQRVRVDAYVAKHRRDPLSREGMRRSNECEGRQYDFARKS